MKTKTLIYKGAAERFAIQDAMGAYEHAGIATQVNDGKDITVVIENMDLFMADYIKKSWRRQQDVLSQN